MANKKKYNHSISIRLHTQSVSRYEDVLKDIYKSGSVNAAVRTTISRDYGKGVAFSLLKQPSRPNWASDFEKIISKKIQVPDSEYSKAVVVLKITTRKNQTRFMSVTFGYGESLLDSSKIENDFGKSIAAQKIPESGVLSADTIQISDAIIQIEKQYVGARTGGIGKLVTSQSEFPSSISGTWRNGSIETRLEGRGSLLKAKRTMDLEEMVSDLEVYLDAYLNPVDMAEWAMRLNKIEVKGLRDNLNTEFISNMINGKIEFGLAWPDYRKADELSTNLLKNIPCVEPVDQLIWYVKQQVSKNENYSSKQLMEKIKKSKLVANDENGQKMERALYSGLFVDMFYKNQRYLLFNGVWYKVLPKFYKSLDEKIKKVPEYEEKLPALKKEHDDKGKLRDEREDSYNKRLSKFVKNGELFDKVNFNNGKGNKFPGVEEPADVITSDKKLFFVKKGGSSAELSHLFLQGLVSAKLLARNGDGDFRKFINKHLSFENDIFTDDVINSDVTLVFVIIKKAHQLPFFSMVSFSEVLDNLREMGYRVKIAWV